MKGEGEGRDGPHRSNLQDSKIKMLPRIIVDSGPKGQGNPLNVTKLFDSVRTIPIRLPLKCSDQVHISEILESLL